MSPQADDIAYQRESGYPQIFLQKPRGDLPAGFLLDAYIIRSWSHLDSTVI
jgi:hypothetical protein